MNEAEINFGSFGKPYQEKVVQAFLTDSDFAEQMIEVLNINFFEQMFLRVIAKHYFQFYAEYNAFPSHDVLLSIINNNLTRGEELIIKKKIEEYFIKIDNEPLNGDEKYIKESALDFCRRQSLKSTMYDCVDLIQTSKYDQIVDKIKKSIELGAPKNYGHDYFNDIEKRHSETEARQTIPTGWDCLDANSILNGGLARGELGTIMGVAGSGKSLFLVHLGAHALKMGFNVLHYTFELSENNIGIRYDACLTGVSQNDAFKLKSAIKQYLPKITNGALFIKGYPTKSANVQTLKNHIRVIENAKDFKPDLIIVDYADIMKSTKSYEAKRFELECVYEELRALAQELNVAVYTASQTNRSASNQEIVELDSIGESWAKVQIADIVLTFSRKREDKLKKSGRVYLAKNRIGRDGIVYQASIDTEICSIALSDYTGDDNDISEADRTKITLQEKWDEFKRSKAQ